MSDPLLNYLKHFFCYNTIDGILLSVRVLKILPNAILEKRKKIIFIDFNFL